MVRVDMSEYQQPDSVDRLLSDGKEEHKSLIMAVREQPFSVVLLDEIEKAHPNVLNILLQMFDEGRLTDTSGKQVSFKDCVIVVTSNAGAQTIRERVQKGEPLESFREEFIDQLINSGQFKPELLNRFDEMVLFRPLEPKELTQVVALLMREINQTLANQNITRRAYAGGHPESSRSRLRPSTGRQADAPYLATRRRRYGSPEDPAQRAERRRPRYAGRRRPDTLRPYFCPLRI